MSIQSHRSFFEQSLADSFLSFDGDTAAALAAAKRRFEATFLHAPVGIAHVGLDGGFLLVNPRFCEICGHDADTLMRTGFQQITHPDDLHSDEGQLARLNAGDFPRYTMEKRYIRADGSIIWVNLTVAMVRDEADRPEFYVAVVEDMSELRNAYAEAMHDPLTNLLNRRGLAYHARDLLAHARETEGKISLLFLDLDGFKTLNDTRGHAAGDACLVAVARLIERHAPDMSALARIGGDEFLILSTAPDPHAAVAAAQRLQRALSAEQEGLSGSFGLISVAAAEPFDLDALIDRADGAMLAAKRAGKNRIRTG